MSHATIYKTKMTDMEQLKTTLTAMGFTPIQHEGRPTVQFTKAQHNLLVAFPEVDGTITVTGNVLDGIGGRNLRAAVGSNFELLESKYTTDLIVNHLTFAGHDVENVTYNDDGTIEVVANLREMA